ncbi:MAG: ADP-glyceromanno-heptose 6-epimerase [Verrucomicrobiaceae bacterium]|nr:ADP-glyceromanno-heptose 6-epimerase [Verrucomicrobiaceae bacterium]
MALSAKGKILVTGGAGFIGSALVWALNNKGYDNVIICDRLEDDERWANLVPLQISDYIDADDLLEGVSRKSDYLGEVSSVFHLGACSDTTETDAGYLLANNFEYTKALANWALQAHARFIYASSAATYGDGERGMDDSENDLSRYRPLNMYAYSKHLFDCYAQRNGMNRSIIGLKYFNVFGPNEGHKGKMRSVVNKAFYQILETGRVNLFKSYHQDYADGHQERDFLYVKDAVDMTLHLAGLPIAGGLFNIGSGLARTWVDLVMAIFSALGREAHIDFIEMPDELREKYQYHTCANISRLRDAGYKAEVSSLEDAVRDYVQNYLVPGEGLGNEA